MPTVQLSLEDLYPEVFGKKVESEYEPKTKLNSEQSSRKEEPVRELSSIEYWQYAIYVINIWAEYQSKKKLLINATHDETRHRVQSVVNNKKYYDGSLARIRKRRDDLSGLVDDCLSGFNKICSLYKVDPVSREWLYDHLKGAKDYQSYRGKCLTRFSRPDKYPAASLREL